MAPRVRPISLASRFLATLLLSCLLPLLVYGWFSLRGMRGQIDDQVIAVFLPQLAADHAQKIDARLQQIEQACAVVREVARRALDSRADLVAFEEQVLLVPDLLDNYLDLLLLADDKGEVVYWQDGQRLDPCTHGQRAALIPTAVADTDWFRRATQGAAVRLPWGRSPYLHRGTDYRSTDPAEHHLGLALDVPHKEGPPGVLFALIRWAEVQQILDAARTVLVDTAGFPSAEVFLVDATGRIQAHTDRGRYGEQLSPEGLRASLLANGAGHLAFTDPTGATWRAGFARCGVDAGARLMLGLAMPEAELFARSDAFERVLVFAIAVTAAVLLLWSLVASRAILRPVGELVAATRRVAAGDLQVHVPARGGPELGELAASFNRMAQELAAGRQRLAAAERDQAWAEMARQIAHEVKNPLTPMRLAAQLLQRARAEGDPRAEAIAARLANTVLEQTEVLDRIASDFRAFAGRPAHTRELVQLDQLLTDVRQSCAALFEGGKVDIGLRTAAPGAVVRVDRRALDRVFLNLLQNAADAAPSGVRVMLVSAAEPGRALIRIEDDGPGIAPESRQRLFEPWFTTKTSGTGLGLAICRRIVEAHDGSIGLESSAPGRTVFVIELPLATGDRGGDGGDPAGAVSDASAARREPNP